MSSLSPLGTRQYQNTALAGSTQQPARGNNAVQQTAASKASSNVALSSGAADMQARIDSLGNDTIDLAQNFLGSFAQQMLGDKAKGATIAFDSVALEASSTMAAGTMRSEGANGAKGVANSASAFSLNESSHFLGKGTITLADGTKYDFEVEVQYEASMSAGYASSEETEGRTSDKQNPTTTLPSFEFPDIDWPGSLGDLFKLMDKQISGDVVQTGENGERGDVLGNLSLRLMQLIQTTQSLDTYAPPSPVKAYESAAAAEEAKEAKDAKKAAEPDLATDAAPVKVPVPSEPIPLTISTTPPAGDAA